MDDMTTGEIFTFGTEFQPFFKKLPRIPSVHLYLITGILLYSFTITHLRDQGNYKVKYVNISTFERQGKRAKVNEWW